MYSKKLFILYLYLELHSYIETYLLPCVYDDLLKYSNGVETKAIIMACLIFCLSNDTPTNNYIIYTTDLNCHIIYTHKVNKQIVD